MTHLELDWNNQLVRSYLDELGARYTLTRYDHRGQGRSDWSVSDLSLKAFVDGMDAVFDRAGVETAVLLGMSQGGPVAMAFAARHPERVRHLVLYGSSARGRLRRPEDSDQALAMVTLIKLGWGKPGSPFVQAFTSMYMPNATTEQIQARVLLHKQTTSAENAVALRIAVDSFDVSDLLGRLSVSTPIIHSRNDGVVPLEQARELAAEIPDAELAVLESDNHLLLPGEPAFAEFLERVASVSN